MNVLEKITDWAIANGGDRCFVGWPRETVRQYIAFHAQHNTLAIVHEDGEPVALGTAMQCNSEDIGERWDWRPTNPNGQFVVILDVVSTKPGAFALLALKMFEIWPPGRVKKIFALRPSGPREITPRYLKLAAA
jgi:hypothetical protein